MDGCELGEGPTVFPVPVLLAAPEEVGPFLFRLFYNVIIAKVIIYKLQLRIIINQLKVVEWSIIHKCHKKLMLRSDLLVKNSNF